MKESKKSKTKELTLTEEANYSHVCRQAIYKAITSGRLTAEKSGHMWYIALDDLEMYRANKYRRDLKEVDGVRIFDLEKGHFSVLQVSKILSEMLRRPYSEQRLYYKLRIGQLNGSSRERMPLRFMKRKSARIKIK